MADQIMVIEGLESLEAQGVSSDRVAIALARLQEIRKRRAFSVANSERRMVLMRKQLEKLDRSGQDRARRMRLYDEFVAAGKRHDTERRLRDLTGEKINALRSGNLVEYKRLATLERSVSQIRRRVVKAGPRAANAITAAVAALGAKKSFFAHITEPAKAIAAHRDLLKSRKSLKGQYKNLRKRLRVLSAMKPTADRAAAIAKTQEALLVVRRGLAMTLKSVKAQQQILTQRRYVQPGMVRSRPATASLASLPAGVESIEVVDTADAFDLGGYQVEEVDVGGSGDFLKDIKGAGESFVKAKSEVDKFSEGVDAAASAIGMGKGKDKKVKPTPAQVAKTHIPKKPTAIDPVKSLVDSLRTASEAEEKSICKQLVDLGTWHGSCKGIIPDPKGYIPWREWTPEMAKKMAKKKYVPGAETDAGAGMSTGAKIGIVAGALAAVGGVAYFIIKRKRKGLGDVDESYYHDLKD